MPHQHLHTQLAPALSPETIALLKTVDILATLTDETIHCLDGAAQVHLPAEQILIHQGDTVRSFWMLLSGKLRTSSQTSDNRDSMLYNIEPGIAFGEVPLLANIPSAVTIRAAVDSELLQLDEEQFWFLMTTCPGVRKAILGNMAGRLAKMQSMTFQQEKMASLGTLAAGLMHELNNPGSAARRASSQLRANLVRMHQLTENWAKLDLSTGQKQCMFELQERALRANLPRPLSTLEQSDAEEALAEWLENIDIHEAWKIAPTLASVGIHTSDLECVRAAFPSDVLSDTLSWLEAMVSNMQLVGTIEESIGRVTDLVHAVKSYAYEGRGQVQDIDVNASIHATLVILGHKIREKQLTVQKDFGADLPRLHTECQGLNQIWTNLLDNAIDAAPQTGTLGIRTWSEQLVADTNGKPRTDLCVLISDNGPGIPPETQSRIFDPFFTTKPVGVGTGLGLGIAFRIVEAYGGTIRFTSAPGDTEFVVRLPSSA